MSEWTEGRIWLANDTGLIEGTDRPIRWQVEIGGGEGDVRFDVDVSWTAIDEVATRIVVADLEGTELFVFPLGEVPFGWPVEFRRTR
jgi:hypothetical protein